MTYLHATPDAHEALKGGRLLCPTADGAKQTRGHAHGGRRRVDEAGEDQHHQDQEAIGLAAS